ncbi:hypothetical protein ACLB2K_013399 [Fragaria x ananassa]
MGPTTTNSVAGRRRNDQKTFPGLVGGSGRYNYSYFCVAVVALIVAVSLVILLGLLAFPLPLSPLRLAPHHLRPIRRPRFFQEDNQIWRLQWRRQPNRSGLRQRTPIGEDDEVSIFSTGVDGGGYRRREGHIGASIW